MIICETIILRKTDFSKTSIVQIVRYLVIFLFLRHI